MKKSELKSFIKEEIKSILNEESTEQEIEQTKELTAAIEKLKQAKEDAGLSEEEEEPSSTELKSTMGLAKAKDELALLAREMKSLARKYKEAEGEEKVKIVADLKQKTKLKKELEAIVDKA